MLIAIFCAGLIIFTCWQQAGLFTCLSAVRIEVAGADIFSSHNETSVQSKPYTGGTSEHGPSNEQGKV